jgi:hypothetical protein
VSLFDRAGDATIVKTSGACRKWIASVLTVVVIATASLKIRGQGKPKRETIQAQAMGQNRVVGKTFNVTVSIDSYSTPDDQKSLITAFSQGGQAALSKSLSEMKSKGRVAVTGTLGYSIAYVRVSHRGRPENSADHRSPDSISRGS